MSNKLEVSLRDLGIILAFGSGAGGGALVSGPSNRTTTNNAIPTWNGTGGNALNNSDMIYSGGILTGNNAGGLTVISAAGNQNLGLQFTGNSGALVLGQATSAQQWSIISSGMAINRNAATGAIFDNTKYAFQWQHNGTGTAGTDNLALQVYNTAGSAITANAIAVNGNGNLLAGTLTDNSNGRIQLATATTSAGGIGFGTGPTIFQNSANGLTINGLAGSGVTLNNTGSTLITASTGQTIAFQIQGTTVISIVSTGALNVAAASTSRPSINIPTSGGVAPASPVDGDFYYNGTNLIFRNGATSRTITWV